MIGDIQSNSYNIKVQEVSQWTTESIQGISERKLASVRTIKEILPIEGADAIEVAVVDGWKVVVKKNEYSPGDKAIYCEIDSWIPHDIAPFLSKGKEPREYNGVLGERLRTVRLRGQISQGLLLPVQYVENTPYITGWAHEDGIGTMVIVSDGQDLTECLNIQKWEAPIPAQLSGKIRGNFPSFIPKTDQERVQNMFDKINREHTYEVTMKLDGSSCTIFRWENKLRVCSRNLELKMDGDNSENTFVQIATKIGDSIPEGYAFQGELMGPGIQKNRENFKEHHFFVFDVYDIREGKYLDPTHRRDLTGNLNLDHVPVLHINANVPENIEDVLSAADGPSIHHAIREGIVWKSNQYSHHTFKAISNKYLLKGGN